MIDNMLYEIKDNHSFVCKTHGKIKKVFLVNGLEECPHCLLQFFVVNDILPDKSNYRDKNGIINWEIKRIK